MTYLASLIIQLLNIYIYMIIIYIFLGWIQEARTSKIYHILGIIVDPFMRVFRGIFVFNGLDFTPMLGIILLQLLLNFLASNI